MRRRNSFIGERKMVEEAISGRVLGLGRAPDRGLVVSEEAEVAGSHTLLALSALGSGGVLVGFWGLVGWGLYRLFV
jgi:hypothetical protein